MLAHPPLYKIFFVFSKTNSLTPNPLLMVRKKIGLVLKFGKFFHVRKFFHIALANFPVCSTIYMKILHINLIKYNPSESLDIINTESFCKFISDNIEYDEKLDNYYVEKTKINQNIVNRINNYHNNENDDPSLMDLIEE